MHKIYLKLQSWAYIQLNGLMEYFTFLREQIDKNINCNKHIYYTHFNNKMSGIFILYCTMFFFLLKLLASLLRVSSYHGYEILIPV